MDEDINPSIEVFDSGSGDSAGTQIILQTNPRTVVVDDASNLVPGDEVVLHNDITGEEELLVVDTVVDQNTFTVTTDIEGTWMASDGVRVIRKQFPPPLNQISARYAASFIYDKFFAAQAAPNISEYGTAMRNLAMGQMNDILNGKVIMKCARRRGDVFGNAYLDDTYSHRDRGYATTERDMSKPT